MNSLQEASFAELNALLQCLDHYDKSGEPHGGEWRALVFAELRRRFAVLEENTKIMESARAARDAAAKG